MSNDGGKIHIDESTFISLNTEKILVSLTLNYQYWCILFGSQSVLVTGRLGWSCSGISAILFDKY
jgi:hypothetical protein